jgi:pimeloyl-ACP methyl ester carboxylesterase/HEAT repeat protein
LRAAKQVLRWKDERKVAVLEALAGRDHEELLLNVLPELAALDRPIALPRLQALVDDKRPNVRNFAIDTLVAKAYTPALPVLVRLLGIEQLKPTGENLTLRTKLVFAIARIGAGTDAPVDPLFAALAVPDQREAALDALEVVGAPAVKAAVFLLRTADRGRIETALQVVAHLRLHTAPELLPMVGAGDQHTRELAMDVLAHLAVPGVRDQVLAMVRDKKFVKVEQGLRLAITLYDPEVRKVLIEQLKDSDPAVRNLVVQELWRLADPATFEALRRLAVSDPVPFVRMAALQAAVGAGDTKAVDLARKMAETTNTQERLAVIDLLARVDGDAAVPVLARQLADPSDEVFRTALSALRRLTFHTGPRREAEWLAWWGSEQGKAPLAVEQVATTLRKYVVDGREMAWVEAGDSGDKTLVLVSGPPFRDASHLLPHAWALADGLHVVAMRRGVDALSAAAMNEVVLTQDMEKLLAALGKHEPVALAADVGGAHFALAYAKKHPKDISHVVLIGGPWPSQKAVERLPGEVAAAIGPLWRDDVTWALQQHGLLANWLQQRVVMRGVLSALLADVERARQLRADNLYLDGFTFDALDRALSESSHFDPALTQTPTLVIVGGKAPWAKSALAEMQALPESCKAVVKLAVLKNAGALVLVDDAAGVKAAMGKFLE